MLIFFWACGETSEDSGVMNKEESAVENCPASWEQRGDIWIDPITCKAWSPMYTEKTWYESVSSEEAEDGGCVQICDNDPEINFCSDLELEGISNWRTPSIEELEDIVMRTPPFVEAGYIWSATSDNMDEMAWTVDLSDAGMSIASMKSNPENLRCIAD